jgi:hypothetical protein
MLAITFNGLRVTFLYFKIYFYFSSPIIQHMVQKAKKKTVHMEGTWRLESTTVGLHPREVSIQKECEECADTAWDR